MTRHGSLYPLPLPLAVQVVRLTGDVAVAGHVAHPDVLHVGVDLRNTMISNHLIFDWIFDFLTPAVILQICSPKIPFKIKEKMENIDLKSTF